MLVFLIALITIVGLCFISGSKTSEAMDEYCKLECLERKMKKYNYCC